MRKHKSVNYNLFFGALWSVMSRWSMKVIGLVSTIILARLLTPEDFGVVAMASLVVGLLYSFSELGVQTYLIREKEVNTELCNTGWTLQVIQYSFIACLLVVLAPYAALYFDEPRVINIFYYLAIGSFIGGFINIGVVFFLKDLDFKKDFKFNVIKRILVFIITIAAAFELRNYWALVIGQLVGTFLSVILSYFVHPYRPRFSFRRSREFFRFALAIIPMNIGKYFTNKIDVVIVGGIASTSQLGLYNMSSDLSSMFTKQLITPIGRGLFPNFAKLKDQPAELAIAFLSAFRTIIILSLPLAIGFWAIADEFVLVVLGQQWLTVLPFIKWLVFYALSDAIINFINGRILVVTGKERQAAKLVWLRVLVVTGMAVFVAAPRGVEAVAPVMVLATVIFFPLGLIALARAIKEKVSTIISIFLSPLLSSLIMMLLIKNVNFSIIDEDVLRLLSKIGLGIFVYLVSILFLWLLMKKPEGIEKTLLSMIKSRSKGKHSPSNL